MYVILWDVPELELSAFRNWNSIVASWNGFCGSGFIAQNVASLLAPPNRVIVAHEDNLTGGVGGELVSIISRI